MDCHGELVANDDGFPLVRCMAYHLDGGQVDPDFLCDDCFGISKIAWGVA